MDRQASRCGLVSAAVVACAMVAACLAPSIEPASGGDDGGGSGPSLSGRILDKKTGEPVTAFSIDLFLQVEHSKEREYILYREFRDEDGRFRIPLERGGQYYFCVHSAAHEDVHGNKAPFISADGHAEVRVELDSLRTVSGRVVDAESGEPVSGAVVFKYGICIQNLATGRSSREVHAVTDSDGLYVLSGLGKDEDFPIVAIHADHAASQVDDNGTSRMPDIALGREGHRVFGNVLDDEGRPCAGVVIEFDDGIGAGEFERSIEHCVVSDAAGQYRTPLLKSGKTGVRAYSPYIQEGWYRKVLPFTAESKTVEIEGQDVRVDFGPTPDFATWRGRIICKNGLQSPRARIELIPAEVESEEPLVWKCKTVYDYGNEDGSFKIHKILPGRYRLELRMMEYGNQRVDCGEMVVESPGIFDKDIELSTEAMTRTGPAAGTPVITSGIAESLDADAGTDTFSFKVDPNGATVNGIHIEAPRGLKLSPPAKDGQGNPVFSAPERWIFYQSLDGRVFHFVSGAHEVLPPGESEFSITVPLVDGDAPLASNVTFIFTEQPSLREIVGITTRNAAGHDTLGPVER